MASSIQSIADVIRNGFSPIIGESRFKILSLLSTAIVSGRLVAVTQILQKDPSLLVETPKSSDSKAEMPIISAIKNGIDCLIPLAIAQNWDINSRCFNNQNLVEMAVHSDNPNLLSTALLHGASVSCPRDIEEEGVELIDFVINQLAKTKSNDLTRVQNQVRIAHILLDSGAPPTGTSLTSALPTIVKTDWSAIASTLSLEIGFIFRAMTSKGANIDMKFHGQSLISMAIGAKNSQVVELLVMQGCDISKSALKGDLIDMMMNAQLADAVPNVANMLMQRTLTAENKSTEKKNVVVDTDSGKDVKKRAPIEIL